VWENFFHSVEKSRKVVPLRGKIVQSFSIAWKNQAGFSTAWKSYSSRMGGIFHGVEQKPQSFSIVWKNRQKVAAVLAMARLLARLRRSL